jgi:hypothetical protein
MLSCISLGKNFATTLVLVAQQPVYYLRLIGTPRRIALLDKATNKVIIIDLILVEEFIIILIVDTIELRL